MNVTKCRALPFLRWAGGKRWLSSSLEEFSSHTSFNRYIEPFLGGGAVFFNILPPKAMLGDTNKELINAFKQVKKSPKILEKNLSRIPVDREQYLKMRSNIPEEELDRAVRFIYLNRTCFNGIWRTNKRGLFNVPYGQGTRTTKSIIGNNILQNASDALKSVELRSCDYRKTLEEASEGDLVYCDPAYTVTHSNNAFLRYNENVFSWKDQIDLHNSVVNARDRGAMVVVSNAAHESLQNLYFPFKPIIVSRRSAVGASKGRGTYEEYIFVLSHNKYHRHLLKKILARSGLCI